MLLKVKKSFERRPKRIKLACPTELYAIKRFHPFCENAPKTPIKLEQIQQKSKKWSRKGKKLKKEKNKIFISKPSIATFGNVAKSAVTGTGTPSYTSGDQKWKGATLNLKKSEIKRKVILKVTPKIKLRSRLTRSVKSFEKSERLETPVKL